MLEALTEKAKIAQAATLLTTYYKLSGKVGREKKANNGDRSKEAGEELEEIVKKINRKVDDVLLNMASTSISVSLNEEEWFCPLCEEVRLDNMIQCVKCSIWVHEVQSKHFFDYKKSTDSFNYSNVPYNKVCQLKFLQGSPQ